LILNLVATLLRNNPQLADALLGVTIDYNNGQKVDWVDIILAALNVLPGLAGRAAAELQSKATYTQAFAAAGSSIGSSGSNASGFAWSVLNTLADCLSATAAIAACQPSRVLTALCSCQLFEGVMAAAEPLPLVALEDLGGWVQEQQAAGAAGGSEDWSTLSTLQVGACVRLRGSGLGAACFLVALLEGVGIVANAEPLLIVSLEDLGGWVHGCKIFLVGPGAGETVFQVIDRQVSRMQSRTDAKFSCTRKHL
jgi:hypothetical protein